MAKSVTVMSTGVRAASDCTAAVASTLLEGMIQSIVEASAAAGVPLNAQQIQIEVTSCSQSGVEQVTLAVKIMLATVPASGAAVVRQTLA